MHSKDLLSRGANENKTKHSKQLNYIHLLPNKTDQPPSKHQTLQGVTFK